MNRIVSRPPDDRRPANDAAAGIKLSTALACIRRCRFCRHNVAPSTLLNLCGQRQNEQRTVHPSGAGTPVFSAKFCRQVVHKKWPHVRFLPGFDDSSLLIAQSKHTSNLSLPKPSKNSSTSFSVKVIPVIVLAASNPSVRCAPFLLTTPTKKSFFLRFMHVAQQLSATRRGIEFYHQCAAVINVFVLLN